MDILLQLSAKNSLFITMKMLNIVAPVTVIQILRLMMGVSSWQVPLSPCPIFFKYIIKDRSIAGRIEIPNAPKFTDLTINVTLIVPAQLESNYRARLQLADSKEDSIQNVLDGRSLVYFIRFPQNYPLPWLTRLVFNDQEYCIGTIMFPMFTQINLSHILTPPKIVYSSLDSSKKDKYHSKVVDKNCGRSNANHSSFEFEKVNPGEWPWKVAIFIIKVEIEFQCSGSLISDKHVISTASCTRFYDGTAIPTNVFLASLGRYQLDDWDDPRAINRQFSEYVIHPEYGRSGYYFVDIAIFTLKRKIDANPIAQPVCLAADDVAFNIGTSNRQRRLNGVVVGWGKDRDGKINLGEPYVQGVPVVSRKECYLDDVESVSFFTTRKTLCTDDQICNFELGSSLTFKRTSTQQYHLFGILSLSPVEQISQICKLSNLVVFTDLSRHLSWIQEQIFD